MNAVQQFGPTNSAIMENSMAPDWLSAEASTGVSTHIILFQKFSVIFRVFTKEVRMTLQSFALVQYLVNNNIRIIKASEMIYKNFLVITLKTS